MHWGWVGTLALCVCLRTLIYAIYSNEQMHIKTSVGPGQTLCIYICWPVKYVNLTRACCLNIHLIFLAMCALYLGQCCAIYEGVWEISCTLRVAMFQFVWVWNIIGLVWRTKGLTRSSVSWEMWLSLRSRRMRPRWWHWCCSTGDQDDANDAKVARLHWRSGADCCRPAGGTEGFLFAKKRIFKLQLIMVQKYIISYIEARCVRF